MSSKDLDELFQDNLNGRNFEPSESAWSSMESMLDDNGVDSLFHSKLSQRTFKPTRSGWRKAAAMLPKSNTGIWNSTGMRVAAGAAAVIGIAGLVYLGNDLSTEQEYAQRVESNSSSILNDDETSEQDNFTLEPLSSISGTEADENLAYTNSATSENLDNPSTKSDNIIAEGLIADGSNNKATVSEQAITSRNYQSEFLQTTDSRFEEGINLASLGNLALTDKSGLVLAQTETNGLVYLNDYKKPKAMIRHRLGVIGGFNFAQGFESGTSSGNVSGNLFGGVSYNFSFHPSWVLHVDALYQARNGVETHKVLQARTYNFGSSQDVLTMYNKTLHYVELPVHIGYRLNENIQVLAGVSAAYLIGCNNEMVHDHTSPFESWTKTTDEQAIPDGMNQIDIALSAGMAYSITPAIELGARLNYGITDVTDNDYFQNNTVDRNVQLRFNVAYRFLKF